MARIAITSAGYDFDEMLTGPVAIAFAKEDAVGTAKTLKKHVDSTKKLTLKGGLLGDSVLSEADFVALSKLPSREVLLAQVAGTLQSPLTKSAGLFQAFTRNTAYALSALQAKKEQEAA